MYSTSFLEVYLIFYFFLSYLKPHFCSPARSRGESLPVNFCPAGGGKSGLKRKAKQEAKGSWAWNKATPSIPLIPVGIKRSIPNLWRFIYRGRGASQSAFPLSGTCLVCQAPWLEIWIPPRSCWECTSECRSAWMCPRAPAGLSLWITALG